MNYKKLTVPELKSICKKNHIKGYSYLNKDDLIKIIKKNLRKKMKGGDGNIVSESGTRIEISAKATKKNDNHITLDRKKLLELLGYSSEYRLYSKNNAALKELTSIDLSDMNIEEIKENTFKGLSNLETLNLSNNEITEIKRGTFDELSNLYSLNLSKNKITKAGIDVHKDLKNLNSVDLSNNEIKQINIESHMSGFHHLKKLNLSNNKINTINFDVFRFYGLRELETLNLSKNQITSLIDKEFSELKQLKNLDLSYNPIKDINLDIFSFRIKEICLNLSNTGIENEFEKMLEENKKIRIKFPTSNLKCKFNNN